MSFLFTGYYVGFKGGYIKKLVLFILFIFGTPVIAFSKQPVISDKLISDQWHLNNYGQALIRDLTNIKSERVVGRQGFDIGYVEWINKAESKLQKDPVVAVIDTGVDWDHPALKNVIYRNEVECVRDSIPLGVTEEDHDENGYPGDCMGWNFYSSNARHRNRPQDMTGHGTHLAGLIAAQDVESLGIRGVSSRIKILPIKVMESPDRSREGALSVRVARGIRYAMQMGADVAVLSLGWPYAQNYSEVHDVFKEAAEAGLVIIAAAGNDGQTTPVFPCGYTEVICVGSVYNDGSVMGASNRGGHIDILAPGFSMLSTYPLHLGAHHFSVMGYEKMSGTSQAAPLVAAIAALMRGVDPSITRKEVLARLLQSALPVNKSGSEMINTGMAHLSAVFTQSRESLVRPRFKDLSRVSIQWPSGEFEIPIDLENLSHKDSRVEVKVRLDGEGVSGELERSLKVEGFGTKRTLLKGRLENLSKQHRERALSVSVNDKVYEHTIVFNRNIESSEDLVKMPVIGLEPDQNFRPIDYLYPMYEALEFQNTVRNESDQYIINLFKKDGGTLSQFSSYTLPEGVSPNRVVRGDFTLDGDVGYLLIGAQETSSHILIHYFYMDSSFQPLFPFESFQLKSEVLVGDVFRYGVDPKFINTTSNGWLRHDFENGQSLLIPVATEFGQAGDKTLEVFPRDRSNYQIRQRVYYLIPDIESREMRRANIDHTGVISALMKAYGLYFYETPTFISMLHSSKEDRGEGRLRLLFNVGQLAKSKRVELRLNSTKDVPLKDLEVRDIKNRMYEWSHPSPLLGYSPLSYIDGQIADHQGGTAIVGRMTLNRAHILIENYEGPDQELRVSLPKDEHQILNVAKIFKTNHGLNPGPRVLIESQQELMLFSPTDLLDEIRLSRFSIFEQVFSATSTIVRMGEQGLKTGYWTDNAAVNAPDTYVWSMDEGRLFASIRNSFFSPGTCRVVRPLGEGFGAPNHFTFLCLNGEDVELWLHPIH